MLIEFTIENYRSLRDEVTLSLVASRLTARNKRVDEATVFSPQENLRLLKSAVIYGPNASGKSNVMLAFRFMRRFVLGSSRETQAGDQIATDGFRLRSDKAGSASKFEVVFLHDGRRYRYGFEVDRVRVAAEWLFHTPSTKEARLFAREGDAIEVARSFKEGRGLETKTRPNALFLSVVAQFNGEIAEKVLDWFRNAIIISGVHDFAYLQKTAETCADEAWLPLITDFVRGLDTGVTAIQVRKASLAERLPPQMPQALREALVTAAQEQYDVSFAHEAFTPDGEPAGLEVFDLHTNESDGTQKLFALSGPMLDALRNGRVLMVDELDARLHPSLTRALVETFNSREKNPRNAQLIFTTHDTHLLSAEVFRRDQIWFTEKDSHGGTDLFSLAEYKVRNDASFERDYLSGRYGAVPFISDFAQAGSFEDA